MCNHEWRCCRWLLRAPLGVDKGLADRIPF